MKLLFKRSKIEISELVPYQEIVDYIYNKGYIDGLQRAKNKKENVVDTIIKEKQKINKGLDIFLEMKEV